MTVKRVLITGASRGIGLELARQYLAEGWGVIAACRTPSMAPQLEELARSNPRSLQIHALEVTDEHAVTALAHSLTGTVIDVLINNAGVMGGGRQDLHGMDYDTWAQVFAVNTMAPLRITMAFLPCLQLSARPRVVTLSSQMGSLQRQSGGYYAYRSSKAAVNKVMQSLAVDLKASGIVVCPVHPGWVRTDMGGSQAELSVQESATGLIRLIDGLQLSHSGRFYQWNGEEHPY